MLSSRFLVLVAVPALFLGGCQTFSSWGDHIAATVGLEEDVPHTYTASEVSQPQRLGIAVADEPLAARAGASVLAEQGSAVDAVTTMFFAMTATYPVAAGLGAGGICLLRDAGGQMTEFDFLTRAPRAGGAYAVPEAVAAFAAMEKLYGALPWQRVVAPGEAFAATGFPISQALAVRLASAQNILRGDPQLAAEFLDQSGRPRAVESQTQNIALSQTLSAIRRFGRDGFYEGPVAANLVAASAARGGGFTLGELGQAAPSQQQPRRRVIGNFVAYLPGPGTGAGTFAPALLTDLSRDLRSSGPQAMLAAVRQSLASFGIGSLPDDLGSTGFSAVDATGAAASCALTLNGPFGSGHTAPGTGVVLAATPSGLAGLASAFLAPVIATSDGQLGLAGAGAGGPNGAAAALYAVLEVARGRALGRRGDLRSTGHAPYDTVNMISCAPEACVALTDPGAYGAGVAAAELVMQ